MLSLLYRCQEATGRRCWCYKVTAHTRSGCGCAHGVNNVVIASLSDEEP